MANRLNTQVFEAQLPAGEEVISDEPTDAVEGYLRLLQRWEALSDRQAAYDKELQALNAGRPAGRGLGGLKHAAPGLSPRAGAVRNAPGRRDTPDLDAVQTTAGRGDRPAREPKGTVRGQISPRRDPGVGADALLHPRGEGTATADKE